MKKVTVSTLQAMKQQGEKFAVLTAYDFTFSRLMEIAEIEVVLVGDSLGNVIQGQNSTLPVTVADMVYHTGAVARGNSKSLLIADMPFMSYSDTRQTCANAALLMQAGAHMVKLEGGSWLCDTVKCLTERGIPVCGHLGLTPQSVHKLGGYKVQGKESDSATHLIEEALLLEKAGIDLLVVECIPASLGRSLSERLSVPVIGIGAGVDTDAQVLVLHDMLGISQRLPSFSHNFLADTDSIESAIRSFGVAVRNKTFPTLAHSF